MANINGVIWYELPLNEQKVTQVGPALDQNAKQGITASWIDPVTKQSFTHTFTTTLYMGSWWRDFAVVPRYSVSDTEINQQAELMLQAREQFYGRRLSLSAQRQQLQVLATIIIGAIIFTAVAFFVTYWYSLYTENHRIAAQEYRDKQVYYDSRNVDADGNLIPIVGYNAYLAYLQAHYPGDYSWLAGNGYGTTGSNWWDQVTNWLVIGVFIVALAVFAPLIIKLIPGAKEGG
jgi:hypothetical protein